jgi:DNA-binding response OmpR family regulator
MARVLIVDDDLSMQKALELFLSDIGHEVFTASNGFQALELAQVLYPEIIILDIMIPKINGLEVCKKIKEKSNIPIIILSTKDNEVDRIEGFEVGADDYITKPFSFKELELRIRVRLRQMDTATYKNRLVYNDLVIDFDSKQVLLNDNLLDLTPLEFELLWLLASNPNKLFKHQELIESVWKSATKVTPNLLHVYIRRLRNKIEIDPKNPLHLHNVWGQGYIFRIKLKITP